jgi:chemotaxis protein methyltransferase CheR
MKKNKLQMINKLNYLCGKDISKYDTSFLEKTIHHRIAITKCLSVEDYSNFLEQNKEEVTVFLNSLHNSYSKFFRNTFTFSVLEQLVFPNLIYNHNKGNKRKEIRIWSSACASGQEAYSLAIVLEELKNGDNKKFSYCIFATDLSELQIKKAKTGKFTKEELGNMNLKYLKKWFIKKDETYVVKPALKKNIYFSTFDLFNEQLNSPPKSIFGGFDLIFNANLLFYYNKKHQKIILKKVANNLVKGGFVITGEVEREILIKHNYKEVFPQTAIFRKEL